MNKLLRSIGDDPVDVDGKLYKNSKIIAYEGIEYIVSNNAILTVNALEGCNAGCGYCYNGVTFMSSGEYVSISNDLQKAIDFCKIAGINTVAITGGEPTLNNEKLHDLFHYLSKHFHEVRLHTNGFGLFLPISKEINKPMIDDLLDNGLWGLSISIAHYDEKKNADIMQYKGSFQGLSKDQLRHIGDYASQTNRRLSCFLHPQGVNNSEEMLNYIAYGNELGFRKFIFRTSGTFPEDYVKDHTKSHYLSNVHYDIDTFVENIKIEGYKEIFQLHKSDMHIHVLSNGHNTVDFEESSEEIDIDSKIRRLNYMPNGITYTSRLDSTSVLFDTDKDKIINRIINGKDLRSSVKNKLIESLSTTEDKIGDFHIHSLNSDGKKDFQEIIMEAKKEGLKYISFTEHNFISDNIREVSSYAKEQTIGLFFPGIELNTIFTNNEGYPERRYHVLAYGKFLLDPELKEYLELPLKMKNNYFQSLIEEISNKHHIILPSFNDLLKGIDEDGNYRYPNKKQMSRSLIAEYIQKYFPSISIERIKELFLQRIPEELSYKTYITTQDFIKKAKEYGGVVGLAHPCRDRAINGEQKNYKRICEIIWQLKKLGMNGLEINHKSYSDNEKLMSHSIGKELGLFSIGGSDYHGKEGGIGIGKG